MAQNILKKLTTDAEKLYKLRQEIKAMVEAYKFAMKPFEQQEAKLTEAVMEKMKANQVKTLRVETGDVFYRGTRTTYAPTDEKVALAWALEHQVVRIDQTRANTLLKREISLPKGWEEKNSEYLTVKKSDNVE